MLKALLFLALAQDPSGDLDLHQLFTEANRLFNAARSPEDLRKAVEDYRSILARGVRNGQIHYNLGSAHLRLREIGPAVLHLRRALLYLPGDPYAQATLEHARKQVLDEFPRKGEGSALQALFFWHHELPYAVRVWAALAANAAFWTLLVLSRLRPLPFGRTLLGALAVLALAGGGSTLVENLAQAGAEAVIVAPEVVARSGNGAGFEPVFAKPVHWGVEVRMLETRGNWCWLEFPGESRGWVPSSAVEAVAASPRGD
jgi:hypothetical protein